MSITHRLSTAHGCLVVCTQEIDALPEPASVEVRGVGELPIRFQMREFRDLITWALRFDTELAFTDRGTFVQAATEVTVSGTPIVAWFHLGRREAQRMLTQWGYSLPAAGFTITAAHAYSLSLAPAN